VSVLVLVAHPDLSTSRANRRLVAAAEATEGVTVRDLYAEYGGGPVDVAAEQAQAEVHDAIVFQHPLHWYSAPPAIQHWEDEVFTLGWAYGLEGSKGMALEGKVLANAVSTGAPEGEYTGRGWNGHSLREFLLPFEGTAAFCGMRYHEPFVTYGVFGTDDAGLDAHADGYAAWLLALTG
jgi:glutathione-regulated potassium-efflux system ancillary protein KefG